ncbi:MAG: DNA polymerase III subunit beta [Armatimonadota bacterium]
MLNVTCARDSLFEAMQVVSRAVSGRSTLPILNNVLMEGSDDSLRLVATDLELSIEASISAKVEDDGALTAPARVLAEVVQNLPSADVTLTVDDTNTVTVGCQKSEYAIRGLPSEEFSTLPEIEGGVEFSMPQETMKSVIEQVTFASSPDETRPMLTGALLRVGEQEMTVVATDTHRLALRKISGLDGLPDAAVTAIVPSRALNELARSLPRDDDDPVSIRMGERLLEFRVPGVVIASRLIEGEFPNYEKVIPTDFDRKAVVKREELANALRRALIVAREDANRIVLGVDGETLSITADSQDVGRASEQVAVALDGAAIEIAFNGRYLLDVLAAVMTEDIEIEMSGALSPGTVRPGGDADYLYVLMPMQIM